MSRPARCTKRGENVAAILSDKQTIQSTMELLAGSPQRRLILDPRPDRWSNNPKTSTFTVLYAFSPPYSTKVFAILSIEMDIHTFAAYDFFSPGVSETEYLLIGSDGSIIYAADAARDSTEIAPQLIALAASGDGDTDAVTGYLRENGRSELAVVSRVDAYELVSVLFDSHGAAEQALYGQLLPDDRGLRRAPRAIAAGD